MAYGNDDDDTPRPLRIVIPDEWAERPPYIPWRKSSNGEGIVQAASRAEVTKLSKVHREENILRDSCMQKARFPIDGDDQPLDPALHQTSSQRGFELRRPHSALKPSSSRRFINHMFSNLPSPSKTSLPQSTDLSASNFKLGCTQRRSQSNTSSRASSALPISTAPSPSEENTVRRRRRLGFENIRSFISASSNPLRVPPPSLLRPKHDSSALSEARGSIGSRTESSVESLDIPTVAFGQLHYLTFPEKGQSKHGSPCSVWVIVEILSSLNQGADKEPFAQKQSTNKSSNNPGFPKSVVLTLTALQNCQITAVLGQSTAETLSPEETITTIILVKLDKSLPPSRRLIQPKENWRPEARLSQRRPTSDVLNDELLNQLLGKFKRTSQAKEEEVEEHILWAKVAYDHSLFPACHKISHEKTVTVKRATICTHRHNSSQMRNQKQSSTFLQRPATQQLNAEETESAAERIIRVLHEGLCYDGNTSDAISHSTINATQAVKLLNDFQAATMSLPPNTTRTLEMLKFRYSMLVSNDDGPATDCTTPPPKRYNPFDRRESERRKSFESESPGRASPNPKFDSDRCNAFEINREEMSLEQGLTDITNRRRYLAQDLLSGGTKLLECTGITDFGKENAIPAPLFSPKRVPMLVPSSGTDFPAYGSARTPEKTIYHRGRQHLQNNIGSASFYAAEVEQMARQAFGAAATTTCYHRSEFLHKSIENYEVAGGRRATIEEEGNDEAKTIWERMRISSEGSGTSAKSSEMRYSDESADEEAERDRDCKIVGAPWLA